MSNTITSRGDNVPINIENQVFFNGKFIDVPDHSPEALYQLRIPVNVTADSGLS